MCHGWRISYPCHRLRISYCTTKFAGALAFDAGYDCSYISYLGRVCSALKCSIKGHYHSPGSPPTYVVIAFLSIVGVLYPVSCPICVWGGVVRGCAESLQLQRGQPASNLTRGTSDKGNGVKYRVDASRHQSPALLFEAVAVGLDDKATTIYAS